MCFITCNVIMHIIPLFPNLFDIPLLFKKEQLKGKSLSPYTFGVQKQIVLKATYGSETMKISFDGQLTRHVYSTRKRQYIQQKVPGLISENFSGNCKF